MYHIIVLPILAITTVDVYHPIALVFHSVTTIMKLSFAFVVLPASIILSHVVMANAQVS
jgi:hypothetical protein